MSVSSPSISKVLTVRLASLPRALSGPLRPTPRTQISSPRTGLAWARQTDPAEAAFPVLTWRDRRPDATRPSPAGSRPLRRSQLRALAAPPAALPGRPH